MKKIALLLGMTAIGGATSAQNVYTPYWYDGFDAGPTSDINLDVSTRQGGVDAGTRYATNLASGFEWQHQMFGTGPLQLAATGGLAPALVSPDFNFVGTSGSGEIIGKKIQVVVDTLTNIGAGNYYTQAAVTVGGSSTLSTAGTAGGGFSVAIVEDGNFGNGNFLQVWDGDSLIGNAIANPAGSGGGFLEIFVEDPTDGNPWNGAGAIEFSVFIDGTNVVAPGWSFSLTPADYTSNYITLQGDGEAINFALATHTFDDLTVSTAPVPEPATIGMVFGGLVFGFVLWRRRSSWK